MNRYLSIFWFRRDLRIDDNLGLLEAFKSKKTLKPVFIFDTNILDDLQDSNDQRVSFIHDQIKILRSQFKNLGSDLWVYYGDPAAIFEKMLRIHPIANIYTNKDYEPYGKTRDQSVREISAKYNVGFHSYNDHVIVEPDEILKSDGSPYKVFTAYKKRWLELLGSKNLESRKNNHLHSYLQHCGTGPKEVPLEEMGFKKAAQQIPEIELKPEIIKDYHNTRDFPALQGTSQIGVHLRFGTISIREVVCFAVEHNPVFLSELIWREFFMMILYHFPHTVSKSFKPQYDGIDWRNDEKEFEAWCKGETGYPIVDAGMQQLNKTGYMHNRVRMIVASFLTKHLLIDWRWGEAYFARRLNDFELSSNVGNWQWAAGSGCDAAPYFRVFNPSIQQKKFDKDGTYVNKWNKNQHIAPIVEHRFAVDRCLKAYKKALNPIT